jgi:hypothetical protein
MNTRICTLCKEEKSLDDFHGHHNKNDGKRSECKICICRKKRVLYQNDKERVKERRRSYRADNPDRIRKIRRKYYEKNRESIIGKEKIRYNANPEKFKDGSRKMRLSSYGLTIDQYNTMNIKQAGMCAICAGPPVHHKRLSVDHDHDTGQIRGLLCTECNSGLGFFKDSILILERATQYLKRSRPNQPVSLAEVVKAMKRAATLKKRRC